MTPPALFRPRPCVTVPLSETVTTPHIYLRLRLPDVARHLALTVRKRDVLRGRALRVVAVVNVHTV